MAKKPVISKESELLLKLLRMALGNETDYTLPKDVDWKEVVRLSYEHKVSALAVDGLQMAGIDLCEGLSEEKVNALKSILVPWIKDVEDAELSYCFYVEVLKTLCQIFKDNGLTPIILKGYGLSLNYPRPSHRGAGDIDVFLVDEDGRPAAEEGNRIVERVLGCRVEQEDNLHHSRFEFKGLQVENHYTLVGEKLDEHKESEQLDGMLAGEIVSKDGLTVPTETFNAVYLLLHLYKHCYNGQSSLRQITDYVMLLKNSGEKIDWESVDTIIGNYGLKEFEDGLMGIIEREFGLSQSLLSPRYSHNDSLSNHVLADMLTIKAIHCSRLRIFRHYYANRWHYRFYKKRGVMSSVVNHAVVFCRCHFGASRKRV